METDKQITAAGYIVYDNEGLIHGYGPTADAADADMRRTMDIANIKLLSDADDSTAEVGSWTRESGMKTIAATRALLDMVDSRGGNCAWRTVGGVACTREEEEV